MNKMRNFFATGLLFLLLSFIALPAFAQEKLNLNTASIEQLVEVNGIGEVKAQKIIEYREKHKFTSVDQLVDIKGIGEKLLEQIRDQVTVKKKKK